MINGKKDSKLDFLKRLILSKIEDLIPSHTFNAMITLQV